MGQPATILRVRLLRAGDKAGHRNTPQDGAKQEHVLTKTTNESRQLRLHRIKAAQPAEP
jgi:hypothetical protein